MATLYIGKYVYNYYILSYATLDTELMNTEFSLKFMTCPEYMLPHKNIYAKIPLTIQVMISCIRSFYTNNVDLDNQPTVLNKNKIIDNCNTY